MSDGNKNSIRETNQVDKRASSWEITFNFVSVISRILIGWFQ